MSATVDRAFAVASERDYTGAETRVLLRMAMDADHDSGENCTTSLARLHRGGRLRGRRRPVPVRSAHSRPARA